MKINLILKYTIVQLLILIVDNLIFHQNYFDIPTNFGNPAVNSSGLFLLVFSILNLIIALKNIQKIKSTTIIMTISGCVIMLLSEFIFQSIRNLGMLLNSFFEYCYLVLRPTIMIGFLFGFIPSFIIGKILNYRNQINLKK